ncbi:hypothetical protein GCM10023174_10150 [Chelativorans composti]|uniref:Uncharacterized protein n=1 Tax=Chelativorans composti TaxID=768533 RepID=A0ABW5DJ45_9HYPH
MADTPSMTITPAKVGFVLSLVTTVTVGWNAVSYFKAIEQKNFEQDQAIQSLKESGIRLERSTDRLTSETGQLRIAVERLTTIIDRIEQNTRQ